MKYSNIIYLLIIIITLSCQKKPNSDYYESYYINNYDLTPVDTLVIYYDEDFLPGRIAHVVTWNSFIFITDRECACIWVFDDDFNFLKRIGRKGSGPGEFTDAPIPLLSDKYFWLIDNSKRAYQYDMEFTLLKSNTFPSDLFVFPIPAISLNGYYLVSGGGNFPQSDPSYYNKFNSLFILDTELNVVDNILEWDGIYFDEKYQAFAFSNFVTNISYTNADYIYARQNASYIIHKLDNEFMVVNSFGRPPLYHHPPKPGAEINEIQQSLNNYIDFMDGTTTFGTLYYDKSTKQLYSVYYNVTRDAIVERNPYRNDRYLQIYNYNYDLIYDGPIQGLFMFAREGYIYIRDKETPEYMKIISYQLLDE